MTNVSRFILKKAEPAGCRFRRFGIARAVVLVCAASLVAMTGIGAFAQELKIGIVDVERVTRQSERIRAELRRAEEQVKGEEEGVEAKLREYRQLKEQLGQRRSVMNEADVRSEETKLSELEESIKDQQHEVQKEIDKVQRDVMDPLVEQIFQTVREIGRRDKYALIVRLESVLYHDTAVDITPLVIQELDRAEQEKQAESKTKDQPEPAVPSVEPVEPPAKKP